jgi:hypothetical protein
MPRAVKHDISDLLYSDDAKNIYRTIRGGFSDAEQLKYQYLLADYCNERAVLMRIHREIAETDSLITTHVNSHSHSNEKKHELLRARKESADLVLKYDVQLQLTPRASKGKGDGDSISIELPP